MTKGVFQTQANWDAVFADMGYFFESENAFRNARDLIYRGSWAESLEAVQEGHFTADQDEWEVRKALSGLYKGAYNMLSGYCTSNSGLFEVSMLKVIVADFLEHYHDITGGISEATDSDGNITFDYDGLLGALRSQMENSVTLGGNAATGLSLARVYNRSKGVNTDADGILYGLATGTASSVQIKLYLDDAHSSIVASGTTTGSAGCNPSSITIVEQTSSGLSGTIYASLPVSTDSFIITPQSVNGNAVTSGSTERGPGNGGRVTIDGVVALQQCANNVDGEDTVLIKCTDATIGSEYFSVNGIYEQASGTAVFGAKFRSADLGIEFQLERLLEMTAGTGSMAVSAFNITGINASNCSGGTFYARYSSAGTYLTLYSDSDRSNSVAVGACADAAGTVTLTAQGGGVAGTIVYTAKDSSGTDFTITINKVSVDDEWSIALTNDWAGIIQAFFCRNYNMPLPCDIAGGETITDPDLNPIDRP